MSRMFKKGLRHLSALLFGSLLVGNAAAQDIHFSQFFEAPLLRNPSLAGLFEGDVRAQVVYRDQWNSVTNAYRTGSLNAEYKMPVKGSDFVTAGVQILYDKAGTVGWTSAHLKPALNYHKSLSENYNRYLSLGFMAGPVQRRIDRSKMTTNESYEGRGDGETFPRAQYTYVDASVGMSFNSQLNENPADNFFVGLAYHHFTRPKNSFYQSQQVELDPNWVASAGVRFGVTPASYITLQGDYMLQNDAQVIIAGALYGIKIGPEEDKPIYTLHGGAFLRWNDAFIPVVKLDYRPFSVSLSYDLNISKLRTSSFGRGGFELGISYVGFLDRATSTEFAVRCPRF
ncbi:PorP/SprF family type IX secretion system membrane protein [Paracnuella aquatica]|uniref:PorP/SprF family type IX secretion system membrane protein n=1 Tax=Paracnuella aquatica TaxID=2268757 RepID=UPI001F4DE33F|nr:PorP/SprF family type IX secretion system membrane protein [Paracnuella aquatica]